MALTLSQLCVNVEKTYQMKLVAGEDGMDNVVRWVHIIEDVEVSHFINGQELVFTTGIAQRGVNWLLPYAEQLLSHGAVGLVINLGPYIEKSAAAADRLVQQPRLSAAGAALVGAYH